jgi:uncharacterized protein YqeY
MQQFSTVLGVAKVWFPFSKTLELAVKEEEEMDFIREYLPRQRSIEDVAKVVQECIEESGATSIKDLGKVIKLVYTKIDPASANKQMTSELIKKAFSA